MANVSTGYSGELFPGAEIIQFALATFPTILLCIIAMVAIVKADGIDYKLKVIMLNIFVAEIYFSVGMSLSLLGFRVRLLINDDPAGLVIALCRVTLSAIITGGFAKILSITLYAIAAYIFVTKNIRRIKIYAIIVPQVLIWVLSIGFGIRAFTIPRDIPRVFVYRGFCSVDLENTRPGETGFLIQLVVAWVIEGFICGGLILTFSILTYCFIKKNTIGTDKEVKHALARNLFYLAGGAFFTITNAVVIPTLVFFISFQPDTSGDIQPALIELVVSYSIIQGLRSISSIYIPVVTITLVKVVRKALKQCIPKCGRSDFEQ